jgi:hypothetical protein
MELRHDLQGYQKQQDMLLYTRIKHGKLKPLHDAHVIL